MAQLKIDIDHRRNYQKTKKWLNYRLRWIEYTIPGLLPATITVHRTHKGFHFVIDSKFFELDNKSIVCLQACLGSDWLREVRNLNRIRNGMTKNWNILFVEKFDGNFKTKSREKYVAKYFLKPRK